ncbi:hypothetical protein PILCRDRAFT_817474, partial [Piloderma croceum F 1598]
MNVIGSKLKLLWERIIFSRLTIIYFIFSVVHFSIQVIFQIQAFSINDQAGSFLYSVVIQGNATDPNGFPVLGENDLRMCDHVPSSFSTSSCRVVWNGTALDDNVVSSSSSVSPPFETVLVASNSTVSSSTASTMPSVSTGSSVFLSSTAATPTVSKSNIDNAADATTTVTIFAISTAASSGDGDNGADTKSKRDHTDFGTIVATSVDGQIQVKIDGLGYNDEDVTLDRACLGALDYPLGILLNTKREDITFIAFQFWVLGMSTMAILNESIPHIIASLLTHMLATAWAGFQIAHTADFKADFSRLVTNGACKPIDLLPHYWEQRRNAEIPSLALNVAALLTSAFLTWKLVKLFGWQTFKRVGASMTINRVYKLVLILSITIQLSLFFMVVTVALWIDQLWNGGIAHLARLAFVYKPVFIIVLILLVPWLMTGWFAVRRELKAPMLIFLVLSFGYLAGWGAMFSSTTFRWTFVQWLFFALIASSSVILTFVALILGLICRLNFGKGLPRYLSAQEPIPDERIPDPYASRTRERDPEKVDFPSHAHAIPTFSAAFGSGDEVPPPNQMFAGRQRGPRFYNAPTELSEQQRGAHVLGELSAHNRSPRSIGSWSPERGIPHSSSGRHSSQWSVSSASSWSETAVECNYSQSSQSTSVRLDSKRWVI